MLAETIEDEPQLPDQPVILVAEDLTPSDTARLDPKFALGLCTAGGGPTSHTSIIARSLDIPAVVSAGDSVLDLADGTPAILDGNGGLLVIEPTEADEAQARQALVDHQAQREAERKACYKPAIMTDGTRIEVVANISDVAEAAHAVEAGGEGVGLLRTEFLFLQRDSAPSEDEQFETYSAMTKALNGLPIIIRTLDIGGDKEVPYLQMPAEMNPFLGERGIRLCLARKDLFRTQLRAIFRAAATGPVRIMYPMIAPLEELQQAKEITEEVRRSLGADPVEIGMMIEVPSSAIMADDLRARGRLLLHRHQRPDPVRPRHGPAASAARQAGGRPASGGAADDRQHGARRRRRGQVGRRLRRRRRRSARRRHPHRPRRARTQRQHPQHRRGQGADPRPLEGQGAEAGPARARLPDRRRGPGARVSAAVIAEEGAVP